MRINIFKSDDDFYKLPSPNKKVFSGLMKAPGFCFFLGLMLAGNCAFAWGDVDKVNIYVGHFLLQSWPKDQRMITMDIDTTFPPDTLIFQAVAAKGGLKNATLEIRDLKDNLIEEVARVTRLEDETEATFMFVLNTVNVRKIKERKFRVILDTHAEKESGIHDVAFIFLNNTR